VDEEPSAELWIDFDGFFGSLLDLPPTIPAGAVGEERMVALLHFLLRSAASVSEHRSEETWQEYQHFSRSCLVYARHFAPAVASGAPFPPPTWARDFHGVVADRLRPEYPDVDGIQVVATFEHRLSARSFPDRRVIEVSALTREYLKTINLLLWTCVTLAREGRVIPADQGEFFLDLVLPYVLALHRDVRHSLLPIVRVTGARTMAGALTSTRIQLTFLLAHEYAHLLLHDGDASSPEREAEADEFAYGLLMTLPWGYDIGRVWIALRWLFKILELERCVGATLYHGRVHRHDDATVRRGGGMLRHFREHPPDRPSNLFEMRGTGLIVQARHVLARRGASWLRDYATEYHDAFR
jgi:hypothetical protein